MSIVGNRPLPLYEAELLTSDAYIDRFMAPSGLTGLWQVEKRGDSGFGYDPVFVPEGYDRTFAELGNEIKNQISHRALAVNKLCEFLRSI